MTLTPGAATAAPVKPTPATEATAYPPEPPRLTVNRGNVKTGQTVQASGRRYVKNEQVVIVVRFKPKGSSKFSTVNEKVIRADRKGRFVVSVRSARVGTMTIKGRGRTSGLSATVYVLIKSGKNSGSFTVRLASFTPGSGDTAATTLVAKPASNDTTSTGNLALAGFGALALIGSAVATQQVVRRRRRTDVAA
jgi:hypothetical protein